MLKNIAIAAIGLAAAVPTVEAQAQTSSKDALKECGTEASLGAAYTYLTGKQGKLSWDKMATTSNKKLEIDKPGLEAQLFKDATDYSITAFVSIPFSAVNVYARLTYEYVKTKSSTDITVCHYALRESAKSWANFEPADLKAVYGRKLENITSSANVRLGGSAPPAGYRSSTVAVVWATAWTDAPTVKLSLKSEKKN